MLMNCLLLAFSYKIFNYLSIVLENYITGDNQILAETVGKISTSGSIRILKIFAFGLPIQLSTFALNKHMISPTLMQRMHILKIVTSNKARIISLQVSAECL